LVLMPMPMSMSMSMSILALESALPLLLLENVAVPVRLLTPDVAEAMAKQ
jgi:hypothetical protein